MEVNDKITFKFNGKTLEYEVSCCSGKSFFLSISSGGSTNNKIFEILEIDDRYGFCEEVIGKDIKNKSTMFPELDTLQDLEKVVNALYQRITEISTPKFQVGDLVMVVRREGNEGDYPCNYTNEMLQYENRIFTINEVYKMSVPNIKRNTLKLKYEEPFYYSFEGIGWNWSSAMFHKVEVIRDLSKTIPKIDTEAVVDIGKVNIGGVPLYIDTHTSAVTCDKVIDGPSLYPEKSEEPEYKLTFKFNHLKF